MPRKPSPNSLPLSFFTRDTVSVARDLLGKTLVRRGPDGPAAGRIVEVEAYLGQDDPASHAFRGPRGRAAIMFERGGIAYVYVSYGMHHCVNVVTDRRGTGGAVLLRALQPIEGIPLMAARRGKAGGAHARDPRALAGGPGKLAQALAIGPALNGACLRRSELIIREGPPPEAIEATPRIGISKAVEWPLRFVEVGCRHVSRAR